MFCRRHSFFSGTRQLSRRHGRKRPRIRPHQARCRRALRRRVLQSPYAVDVIKVGVPVNMSFVQSAGLAKDKSLYTRQEAAAHFRRASDACSLPFIYLSEGVSNETFSDALAIAAEAGSGFSGVLCGRATWQDGVSAFVQNGEAALDAWLNDQGVKNIQNVNAGLAAARPWNAKRSSLSERTT